MAKTLAKTFNVHHAPGHLIRRAQQLAVALFMEEAAGFDVTPVQFAILNALMDDPGKDQVTLSKQVAFDAATSGSVIARLEAKGWVRREPDAVDKRRKLLWATDQGVALVTDMRRAVNSAQIRILSPLEPLERDQFMALLEKLVAGHQGDAQGVATE